MFYGHNLRSDLQEWRNRLHKSNLNNLHNDYKQFLAKISKSSALMAIIQNAIDQFNFTDGDLSRFKMEIEESGEPLNYENAAEQAAILFILHTKHFNEEDVNTLVLRFGSGRDLSSAKTSFLENHIDPLVNYMHDELDSSNGILYLLEKYKRRTEWFLAFELREKYSSAVSNYEQVFEDDLRMYLFDQGIDYPFSTPSSSSGRADIIGLIETNNPLILEIKIYDKEKSYGKQRIASGFAQVVRYARDYNKQVGYLVVYNLDEIEIQIETDQKDRTFPFRIRFGGKIFYIVVVNLNFETSSSKLKKLSTTKLTMDEIIAELDQ